MAPPSDFHLLRTFRSVFEGSLYKHRDSSLGDLVASQLYEDLVALNKSEKLARRVQTHERVVNLANKAIGRPSRRGDGTFGEFGELVPTAVAITEAGLLVARGEVANIEIGTQVWTTILAKLLVVGRPMSGGTSAWPCGAEQLESRLPLGIAALRGFNSAVVGFRKRLAIILGLLRIERSALKLESGELGSGFVHVA
jgi:hypothetical protein